VAAAVPVTDPGLTFVYGRQSCDARSLEGGSIDPGNLEYSGQGACS
jgi:4-hydroxybutyryl-CoA dehydratase/vinylacetyl-CoA-Delta-isomerase